MPTEATLHDRWLYHVAHMLHEQQGTPRAIEKITVALAEQLTRAERGCVVTFEADGGFKDVYLPNHNANIPDNELWQRLSELARNGRRTVTIGDLSVDQPWPRRETRNAPELSGSAVAVALERESRLLGVLMLYHSQPLHFDASTVVLLEKAARTIAVALDNAEQLQMLADSQALYRRLYKDASFPTIITTLRGDIIDANPKAYDLLGYERRTFLGLPLTAVVRVNGEPLTAEHLSSAANAGELELSATARTYDGRTLPVQLLARQVRLDTADYLVWVAQDMSAHAEHEEARRELAAMIYHDLRGPLHNINLGLTRVEKLVEDPSPAVSQLLQLALSSTRQLTRMVNSLLDLEQLESGTANLTRQLLDVPTLIQQAVDATRLEFEEAGQELELDIAADLPPINGDIEMLTRVLLNLLGNAIKHTSYGGRVCIDARYDGEFVCIAVADNGPGIPLDMRERIFDKYVRANSVRGRNNIGLGLAFCRLAALAHGGSIRVEDNSPQGARFVVALPAYEDIDG